MRLELRYATTYQYDPPVANALTALRLRPRPRPGLLVESAVIALRPHGTLWSYIDGWGTAVDVVEMPQPHSEVLFQLDAVVETQTVERYDHLAYDEQAAYTSDSPRVLRAAVAPLGWQIGPEGRSWSAVESALAWIPQRLSYQRGATDAETEIEDVISIGLGVCQDFAHVLLALLRSWGWPARYVSGYVFNSTDGSTVEAEAMHAWVEVYRQDRGWVGMDPTTGLLTDERYIPVAFGRDYGDVAPIRGMISGASTQGQSSRLTISLGQEKQQQ